MTEAVDGPRTTTTPPGVRLCDLHDLIDGGARNFVLQMRSGRFHGFVVRRGDGVRGFLDRCPHAGLPLAQTLDDYLSPDGRFVACSWHGALFDPDTGACVGGPCVGAALSPWPLIVEGGRVVTA